MNKKSGLLEIFAIILLLMGLISSAVAQDHKANINALLGETQLMSEGSDDITMVWWIPQEFWEISFAQEPSVSQSEVEEFMRVLRPYTIMVVVDGAIGTFGGVTYKSEDYLRANTTIKDMHGNLYKPLPRAQVDADALSLLSTMKPVLENILGPMGENMHFLMFPGTDPDGRAIADAKKEGTLSVELGTHTFKFRLPLGSLLPPKICPVDGEEMNGAWKYCPWHGVELK